MAEIILPEMQDITRQRELAKMLLQKGMSDNLQGQMVSGRYVGASPLQGIANMYSAYQGKKLAEEADEKQQKLAEMIRKGTAQDLIKYNELMYGKEGTPDVVPQGQTLLDDQGQVTMGSQRGVAPIPADPRAAFNFALDSRYPQVSSQAFEMLKPQKLSEGERIVTRNPITGKEQIVMQGGEKYRAPLQIDTGTAIELRDPNDPTKVLQRVPKSQAGQVVEGETGSYLVDTRTGQTKPILSPQGTPLLGGKPMTESQSNATAFGMRAVEANKILTDLEKQGVTSTGKIRSALSGIVGGVPIIGENLESGTYSAMNMLPSVLGGPSAQQQQTDQARRNFVTAVLRKESGAAISPSEFANEEKKYFPQAGDSEIVIKQKQQARDLAIKALETQAGPSGARAIKNQEAITNTGWRIKQ